MNTQTEKSAREIAKIVGVKSNATVANYWKKWITRNFRTIIKVSRKITKDLLSLEEVGLSIPHYRVKLLKMTNRWRKKKMPDNENEVVILKEILKWVKFSGIKEVRAVMTSTLDTNEAYSLQLERWKKVALR